MEKQALSRKQLTAAVQAASMLHTIQQQYREVALLKEQLSQSVASQMAVDSEDREQQIQRLAQNRATSYCEQATASSLALDQAAVSCKQLQLQLSSANEAHALEQQSLNSELRLLRDRGAALDAKVSQLCERAAKAEQQLIYTEEQLESVRAAARSESADLQERLADSQQQCKEGQEQAQIMREALDTRKSKLELAEIDLKNAAEQVCASVTLLQHMLHRCFHMCNMWYFWHGTEHRTCRFLHVCLLYTSPSPRDRTRSRMPSSA